MAQVVVVGGGIAGLAAAYALGRDAPPGTEITIVDGARSVGGKLRVSPIAGLPVDEGAEMFLARVPEAVELAGQVGLGAEVVAPVTTQAGLVVDGARRPLPGGTLLGVPADIAALRAARVLDAAALAAVEDEPRHPGPAPAADIAVGDYVGRRLGRPVVDRLVDPLLGGVYAGHADGLSLRATMPGLAAALDRLAGTGPDRRPVSLVEAARLALVEAARRGGGAPPAGPMFGTLRSGLGALPAAVARAAGGTIRTELPVRRLERLPHGFRLIAGPVPGPTVLVADAVVVAVPAAKAATLLAGVAPWAATELAAIEYASMGIVTLAYPATAAAGLAGSGLLVAAGEGRAVKAVTFSSAKWAHLAGGEVAVLRASVGRHGEEHLLHVTDDELTALVSTEVAALTGIAVEPVAARVSRWGGALPQYAPGHGDRVRRLRAAVGRVGGLAVCGAAYDGVGVPACIRSGYQAAALIVDHLRATRPEEAESAAWSMESRPASST